jgi:hypothetical protein
LVNRDDRVAFDSTKSWRIVAALPLTDCGHKGFSHRHLAHSILRTATTLIVGKLAALRESKCHAQSQVRESPDQIDLASASGADFASKLTRGTYFQASKNEITIRLRPEAHLNLRPAAHVNDKKSAIEHRVAPPCDALAQLHGHTTAYVANVSMF